MLWNKLYKNNGNELCQLQDKQCNKSCGVTKTKQNRLIILAVCVICNKKNQDSLKIKKLGD